ncbi:hypothetical protein [Bdellovibrio sp. BCCA]|uniref:hypothetical protein n=1 Tax=Bdellovibrio sp. BCCA TaxID=3136281 RepID=UPI0030F21D59
MKKLMASFLAIYSALLMVSCAKDSGGDTVINPVIPSCAAGQVWNGTVCVNNTGVVPTNGVVRYYDYNRYFYNSYYGVSTQNGDMQIVNAGAYKEFLKQAMAVCDRNIWGWQAGLADCNNWVSGSFQIEFSVDSSLKPTVSFTAYPAPNWYQYTLSVGINGGGMAFNPLYLNQNNTFSLINNSKGFEIRAQGSYWNGGGLKLIQIQVLQGTLQDGYFTYDLYFPYNNVATKIATGKFKRR